MLLGLGWLAPTHVDEWRQGRVAYLEGALRFSASNDPGVDQAYRMHWISPELSERKRERLAERQSRPPDLLVIAASKPWRCAEYAAEFGAGAFLLMEDAGPHCMDCVDLGHLEFLPAGNPALTRRAKKASRLSAVVVQWSRSRKRYERQGILAEPGAIERAEAECLPDDEVRERRRLRDDQRRSTADDQFAADLAAVIRTWFRGRPAKRAARIARHAGERGSGRIGRTRAGRALDPQAVGLAVIVAVRHDYTAYDQLLMSGMPRAKARDQIRANIERILTGWSSTPR